MLEGCVKQTISSHVSIDSTHHIRKVVKRGKATWNVLGPRKTNSSISYEIPHNCEHSYTAVLELNPTQTIKVLLVTICAGSKWIKETEWLTS